MGRRNVREEAEPPYYDAAHVVDATPDDKLPELPDDLKNAMKGWSIASFRRIRQMLALGGRKSAVLQYRIDNFYRKRVTDVKKAGREDTVETLTGWVETRTPRAILFHSDLDPDEEGPGWWLPLSQITRMDELGGGANRYEIDVKTWLVQKNGYQ